MKESNVVACLDLVKNPLIFLLQANGNQYKIAQVPNGVNEIPFKIVDLNTSKRDLVLNSLLILTGIQFKIDTSI